MIKFRRRIDNDRWHWCTNCSNWPEGVEGEDYETYGGRKDQPSWGELCDECDRKDDNDNCSY